jgi:hypothetical protein
MNLTLSLSNHLTRRVKATVRLTALAGVLLLGAGRAAHADSIGVNFTLGESLSTLAPTTSAGVVPQTNFNNLASVTGNNVVLNNNNGVATSTTVTYSVSTASYIGTTPSGGDEQLNRSFFAPNQNVPLTLTLNNISYNSYDIYVYNPGFNGVNQQTTLGGTSFFSTTPDPTGVGYVDGNAATPYIYTQATSTNSASPTAGANYVRFSGLTGTTQSFSVTGLTGRGTISGFQIVQTVPTPEPGTWAMMALGLGALGLMTWKRRRSQSLEATDLAGAI